MSVRRRCDGARRPSITIGCPVPAAIDTIEQERCAAAAPADDESGDAPLPDAERERAVYRRTWELVAEALDGEDLSFS